MAISAIGVGSGLPLDELLVDLRKAESAPLALIQNKQAAAQSRISAYGTLKSSIEQLQKAAAALENTDTYGALKASIKSDAVTVKADASAIEGQYSLKVLSMATTQTLASQGVADRDTAIGAGGVITFTLGDGSQKTLDLGDKNTSINGLIEAINADKELGLRATVINDGQDSPYRLLITTTETGTDAAISAISVSGNTDPENALQQFIGFGENAPGSTLTESAATNAQISINGIAISSHSNTIDNAIEGISITLTGTPAPDETLKLNVSRDDAAAKKAITGFVDAYNNLQKNIRSLTSYDVEAQQGSALTGDALVRRVQTQFRDALSVTTQTGQFSTLSSIGITTDPSTGQLKVDDGKLSDALAQHPNAVQQLFVGENRITGKMATTTDFFLRSKGALEIASDGATRQLNDLQKQFETSQQRIDARIEAYRRQFTALDSMVAQMNSVSTYLTQQLSMLSNLNEQK